MTRSKRERQGRFCWGDPWWSLRLPLVMLMSTACLLSNALSGEEIAEGGTSDTVTSDTVDEVLFAQQIRPILSSKCFNCHGPDEASREADLRLDTREGAFADLGDYQILVAGKPEASELYRRIATDDPDERMPPVDSEHELSAEEIALFKAWIEQGASWDRHWSFVTPTRPELPEVDGPKRTQTPIDHFILARIRKQGLSPSTEADRQTLIRRLTFDLTGLPPKLQDVQAFVADASPQAYEKMVDRLLASEHYGEHMARFWLDAARYADTHGMHADNYREMWPFRDWVIGAFNANMPYDQFLVEQLAGDLLPDATLEQQVASGFNRCHVSTNEGGSIDEEVYVRNVVDRVSTFGTTCLGLTLGCAVCHDHKFDPVSQKEFYQFFAFFNSLDGQSMDGNVKDPAPSVRVPSEEQVRVRDQIELQLATLDSEREIQREEIEPELQAWLQQRSTDTYQLEHDQALQIEDGLLVHCHFDEGEGVQVANLVASQKSGHVVGSPSWVAGKVGGGLEFTADGYVDLGKTGDFKSENAFSFGAWVKAMPGAKGTVIAKMKTKGPLQGYEMRLHDGYVRALLTARYPGYAIEVATKEKLCKPNVWHHVFVTYDGSKRASGVGIYVDGKLAQVKWNVDSLEGSKNRRIDNTKPLQLGRHDPEAIFSGTCVDEFRMYDRRLSASDVEALYLRDNLAAQRATAPLEWTSEQEQVLRQLYLLRVDPVYRELMTQIESCQKRQREHSSGIPTTLVFRERSQPRDAFVLNRGEYDLHGEKVVRTTPEFLPPFGENSSRDRLGLAEWLISADHPLTSRVAVNRFWQQFFGIGLVETSDDFGSQGSPPSHPKLLDWLSVEFRQNGWDVKGLMKQIVMSTTYRQESVTTPLQLQRDPRNRLLARGPRFRLDAEMLRDQALAVSGLLVGQVGGPSVKPPQPAGLWKAVSYSKSNTGTFVQDSGSAVHRRSMYTFWKRTSPPPQMSTLDAPSREACVIRRERTNTPLQALLMMNDPQYIEAARHFAQRILQQADFAPRKRIAWAFEQVTSRAPSANEVDQLLSVHRKFREAYTGDVDSAKSLIALGESPAEESLDPVEMATWTMMANVLLNLDEVVTKE